MREEMGRSRSIPWGKIFGIIVGITAGIVVFIVWKPMWHWLFFAFFYKYWFILFIFIVTILLMVLWGMKTARDNIEGWVNGLVWTGMVVFLVFWLVFSFALAPAITKTKIANSMKYEEINQAPETTKIRYLPLEVAEKLANSQQENSALAVGDPEPLEIDERFLWIIPKIPNGPINALRSQMDGFMIIEDSQKVTSTEQKFRYGEYMRFGDGIFWRFDLKHFFAEYNDPYYLWSEEEGKFIGICSYITYYFDFPVMIPQWGGVMVFHDDGTIEDLSPKEAVNDPRFKDQRLFPEKMAKIDVLAWAFKNGINNAWFRHEEQVQIPDLPNSVNQMPYYLPTDQGPMWMIATEPYGENNKAIYQIFWIDAHNGQIKIQNIPEELNLTGPEIGATFVKSSLQLYWYEKGGDTASGTYMLIEPRPIIRQDELWWMYTVTTKQSIGVSMTVLLKAQDNQVLTVSSKEELNEWLAGKEISPQIQEATEKPKEEFQFEGLDLDNLSKEQLSDLAQKIIEELSKR